MSPVPWLAVAMSAAALPPAMLLGLVWQEREEPGARPYAAMLCVMLAFDGLYVLSLLIHDPGLHQLVYPAAALTKLLVTIPWVLFALEYTGRGRYVTRRTTAALLVPPALALPVLLTPARQGLLVVDYTVEVTAGVALSAFQNGPLWSLLAVFGFVLLGAGLAMLLELVIADRGRYALQTGLLGIAGLVPGLVAAAHVVRLGPIPALDLTPLAFAAVAPLVGFGLVRYDLFAFSPATRRVGQAAAIDDFGDAAIIVDETRRVVDLNERARSLLDGGDEQPVGRPLATLFEESVPTEDGDGTVTLETDRGHREFDVTTNAICGPRDSRIGYTLVLHDITDEKQRRQRFEVLNRVLRHNLRNSMNAVMGFTNRLEEHTDPDAAWMLERVKRQTGHLVELSEKASDIERVTAPVKETSTFAVEAALTGVADRVVAEHEDLAVSVHVPDGLTVGTDRVILEEVLQYAASNLVAHNGASPPKLVLTATPTDGSRPWIDLTITSNGNPVPADERAVIESGEETPLEHSHDIDLWLVTWGVETLGGDLSFITDADRPGVKIRLPDLRQNDEAEAGALS